jgi:hypothetical protein
MENVSGPACLFSFHFVFSFGVSVYYLEHWMILTASACPESQLEGDT